MIAVSNKFTMFVVPKSHIAVESFDFTANRFHTAGFFRSISSGNSRYGTLASYRKSPALLLYPYLKLSFMPKSNESSEGAQGARTASPRKHLYKVLSGSFCKKTFAETENVCIFVVRQNRSHSVKTDTYCTSYTALSLSRFRFGDCGSVARKGGNAFFFAQARNYQP